MRIYRREAFMALPEGVLFAKGKPWYFESLHVKGETLSWGGENRDFTLRDLVWVDGHGSEGSALALDMMLEAGESYPLETLYGRDGCFDEEDLFLVYEAADLRALRALIDTALEHADNLAVFEKSPDKGHPEEG